MKFFVEVSTGNILTSGSEAVDFGGEWGEMQKAGQAVWLDVPAGELKQDCDVLLSPLSVVVNPSKKADRVAKEQRKAARANAMKAVKAATTLNELKAVVTALVEELFGELP